MNALILAAGRGTRLGLDPDRPKCLAQVGGAALIDRYLDTLNELCVPVTIVVGHAAAAIRAHVAPRTTLPALVTNNRFAEGSVVSLAAGLAALCGDTRLVSGDVLIRDDVLILDGDVAFTPTLLARLHAAPATDALLVDVGAVFTDEQYMAGLQGSRVVALRRGPADGHDAQGEWVGFAKLSASTASVLRDAVTRQLARGDSAGGYEDALAALLDEVHFACVPTDGASWAEIDFPADIVRARELFG